VGTLQPETGAKKVEEQRNAVHHGGESEKVLCYFVSVRKYTWALNIDEKSTEMGKTKVALTYTLGHHIRLETKNSY